MNGRSSVANERGDALEFAVGVLDGVDDDAALPAAVGDVHDGALVHHPPRQRLHLVAGDARVVPDAALVRSPVAVELRPVGPEHLEGPVVEFDRQVRLEDALRVLQALEGVGADVDVLCGVVDLLLQALERVDVIGHATVVGQSALKRDESYY